MVMISSTNKFLKLCLALMLVASSANGASSPSSSSSLVSCNKLAVYELRQCLAQHGPNDNNHCWTDSHLAYQECHFAMTNRSGKGRFDEQISKAELKKVQQVSRKVRPKTIKVLLMGAANVAVFKQVVEQSADNLHLMTQLKGASEKQRDQSAAREIYFRKLQDIAGEQLSCSQIKSQMAEFAKLHDDEFSRSAYREIKTLLPTYCRLLQG